MSNRFRRLFPKLLPSWLSDGDGERVAYSLGLMMDTFLERLHQGLYARFPEYSPPTALSAIGRDRRIVRGLNESNAAYSARLLRWLDDHRVRGNPYALMDQLAAYMQASVVIRTVDRIGNWYTRAADGTRSVSLIQSNWDWDGVAANPYWARFWVIIFIDTGEPWTPHADLIGDPGLWSGAIGSAGFTIGSTATPDEVAAVRSIVAGWKPAGTTCEWIILSDDPTEFDPATAGQPLPNPGLWGRWSYENAGASEFVRSWNARYWKGPS